MTHRIECRITGRVQGVLFRDFAYFNAKELGLTGNVRNMPDGSVLAISEGEEEKLKKFIALLQKGSPHSYVDGVETKWSEATGEFGSYEVVL